MSETKAAEVAETYLMLNRGLWAEQLADLIARREARHGT